MSRRLINRQVQGDEPEGLDGHPYDAQHRGSEQAVPKVCIINARAIVALFAGAAQDGEDADRGGSASTRGSMFQFGPHHSSSAVRGQMAVLHRGPDKAIEHIVSVKEKNGLRITSIGTSGPTLEDVFVKLCEVP